MLTENKNDKNSILNSNTFWQKFEVPYEFPVVFTENIFDINNQDFLNVINRIEQNKRHKLIYACVCLI